MDVKKKIDDRDPTPELGRGSGGWFRRIEAIFLLVLFSTRSERGGSTSIALFLPPLVVLLGSRGGGIIVYQQWCFVLRVFFFCGLRSFD